MKFKKLLWPTVVGLLPILMGVAVYSKLPEKAYPLGIRWRTEWLRDEMGWDFDSAFDYGCG